MSYTPRHSAPSCTSGHSRLVRGAALALGIPALVTLGVSAPSYAATTCELADSDSLRVSGDLFALTQVAAVEDAGTLYVRVKRGNDVVACSGGPIEVAALQDIELTDAGEGSGFLVDLTTPFRRSVAPGDRVLIESNQTVDASVLSVMGSQAGPAVDSWKALSAIGSVELDLDAAEEEAAEIAEDADLVVTNPLHQLLVDGGPGDDTIDLAAIDPAVSGALELRGRAGGDILTAGPGNDVILPEEGGDTVDSGPGDDHVTVLPDGAADVITQGSDLDRLVIDGGTGVHVSLDGVADDGAPGEGDNYDGFTYVEGTAGDDTFVSTSGSEQFDGRGDSHTNDSDPDNDGLGDVATYAGVVDPAGIVVEGADPETHFVSVGDTSTDNDSLQRFERIIGSPLGDTLHTDTDKFTFVPGLGDDDVTSSGARTRLVAGAADDGSDEFLTADGLGEWDYSARNTPINVTLDNLKDDGVPDTIDELGNVTTGEGDFIVDAEIAKVIGGSGADRFYGDSSSDQFVGGSGDDHLYGRGGGDLLDGGIGLDRVFGGSGDDQLNGGDGNDSLDGGVGDDREFGDGGDDTFLQANGGAPNGSDRLVGGSHSSVDTVSYLGRAGGVTVKLDGTYGSGAVDEEDRVSPDVEKAVGTNYNDNLSGGAGNNILLGQGGNDMLRGNGGNDTESGGDGNDTFSQNTVANGADTLFGDGGSDTVTYAARLDALVTVSKGLTGATNGDGRAGENDNVGVSVEVIIGTKFSDLLLGSAGVDKLVGGPGHDTVKGGSGNDALYGGAGADVIDGGLGADAMYGESENDRFYAKDGIRDSTINGGPGSDRVRRDSGDPITSIEGSF